jgi:hypothetical protein
MYENYIGKKLSTVEIFNQLPDLAVLGEPDLSMYPTIYITIRHIGTPQEMEAKQFGECEDIHYAICEGKPSRNGSGVIYNSTYALQDLVGTWHTSVTANGSMSNEMLVLCSDGTGAFAEANMGPYWESPINWYVENDILTIFTDDNAICHAPIKYERDVVVPSMLRDEEENRFTGLLKAAYGRDFYRDTGEHPLEAREEQARAGLAFLYKHATLSSD